MSNDKQLISVMIVDDHEIVRRGMASYLEGSDDIELVANVGSGEEAVQAYPQIRPEIVLMDIMMPSMSGIEATRRIVASDPNSKVLALTAAIEINLINDMLAAGAIGYVLKNTPMSDLLHLIHKVHNNQTISEPEVMQVLLRPDKSARPYNLTERELEVLQLLVVGYNNPQIADKLLLARSTVGCYVSSIISKLGVSNRMEVARIANKENLISSDAVAL